MISHVNIGSRVKRLRQDRNMTLKDVSEYSGFSRALISQIENNIVMPPIVTLAKIAKVLNVKITYFFEEDKMDDGYVIVRQDEAKSEYREGVKRGYQYYELANLKSFEHLAANIVYISKSLIDTRQYNHSGYEILYIMEGSMELHLNRETIKMEKGDSIAFNSNLPHYMKNVGEEEYVKIIAICLNVSDLDEASSLLKNGNLAPL